MAQPALDFFIRRGIVMKQEVTEGVDVSPSTSADGILLLEGQASTQFTKKERVVDRSFFTGNGFTVSNKSVAIEGNFEIFAPATPGQASTNKPNCDVLLTTGGMTCVLDAGAKTSKYNPISAAIPSATAHWWHTDTYIAALGCRCDISSLKLEIGSSFLGKVKIQGIYGTPSIQSLPAITTYDTVPKTCAYDISEAYIKAPEGGSDLLVWCKSLEIVFGTKLSTKEYTSIKKNAITGREGTWNMRIAKTSLSDFNPWAIRDACTIIKGRMRMYETGNYGVMSGLYSEIGFRGQIDTIKEVDIDGDLGWDLTGNCIATSAGGDEFYLLFGDDTSLITTSYPNGVHGVTNITQTFSGRALVGTQAWSIIAGALPTGVSCDPSTGAYTGTSAAGTFGWTVQVIDSSTPVPQVLTKVYTNVILT